MTRYLKHARLLAGVLALVVGLTLVAPPAFAAGPRRPPRARSPPPRPRRSRRCPRPALAQAAQAAKPPAAAPAETGNKPFFKTTQGRVALVLHRRHARLHRLLAEQRPREVARPSEEKRTMRKT